jgi:hypothetical protein
MINKANTIKVIILDVTIMFKSLDFSDSKYLKLIDVNIKEYLKANKI